MKTCDSEVTIQAQNNAVCLEIPSMIFYTNFKRPW